MNTSHKKWKEIKSLIYSNLTDQKIKEDFWSSLKSLIYSNLTDQKIKEDFWSSLIEDYGTENGSNEIISVPDEVAPLTIPCNIQIDIITRACFIEEVNPAFGESRVLIALGGYETIPNSNKLTSGLVFSTLFYNQDFNLIIYDLHEDFR